MLTRPPYRNVHRVPDFPDEVVFPGSFPEKASLI